MHKKKSKLRERTQLIFIYSLMITTIVAVLVVLVLVIQGYRYNRYDGKIEQGGLVQFDSQPDGATVSVDGIQLANKTASKITLTAGDHTISMVRDGYNEWKKTVTVKPGTVLWLNYSRLFPTSPQITTVGSYEAVSSAVTSPDNNWMAFVTNVGTAAVTLAKLNTDEPTVSTVALPAADYTAPTDITTQQFTVLSWDKDNRTVLLRHDFDGKQEFIVFDIRGDQTAYNVSAKLGVTAKKVEYSEGDRNVVYILTDTNELRRANLSSTTLSGPLVTNVSDFTAAGQTIITYATLADSNGRRSVGYISAGSNTAKQIASYTMTNDQGLQARAGVYYGDRYVYVAHGPILSVTRGDLPSSDSKNTLSMKVVTQLTIGQAPTYIGFTPGDNRIIYAQYGEKILTYDLELSKSSTITLTAAPTTAITWIDGFHLATTVGTNASYYDYDGTNGQLVSTTATNLPLALSSDDKFLYYFSTDGKTTDLTRVQMTE